MAFAPPEASFSRASMWAGAVITIATRILHPAHEGLWFLIGMFFVVFGLLILPKHPKHYRDLDTPE